MINVQDLRNKSIESGLMLPLQLVSCASFLPYSFTIAGVDVREGINIPLQCFGALLMCFSILASCAIGVNLIHKHCGKKLSPE